MLKAIRQALSLLQGDERWELFGLFGLIIVMAMLQTVGVASILPFMSLVAKPDLVTTNRWLAWGYAYFGFESTRSYLVAIGLVVLGITAFSNAFAAGTSWMMVRFIWLKQYQMSVRLLSKYLYAPYPYFLENNTAGLTKTILSEVTEAVNGMVMPMLRLVAQMVVVTFMVVLLVILDPILALLAVAVLGSSYAVLFFLVRHKQARLGAARFDANNLRYKAAAEAFGSIKETKVFVREEEFLRRFADPARQYTRAHIKHAVITELPRHGLETIAFGGILLVVLYVLSTKDDPAQAVAVMGLYALAGYRLIPAFQHIFDSLAKFRFFGPVLAELIRDLENVPPPRRLPSTVEPMPFEAEISVENVTFGYATSDGPVIRDLSLRIQKHTTVGFVGSTGSGKTTLIDIVLGLLTPQQGSVRVDGVPITAENLVAWRRQIGYVPQSIYLCDDSILRNIAFGLPDAEVDRPKAEWAARLAHLHEFVESLPEGYETLVGERGVRLSGGQRQRIGIARAVYHNPGVLILDEGTSALDGITEEGVMDAIGELAGRKTILLIAHRVSTLRDCDVIHVLADGEVLDSGSYAELWARSSHFRAMAKTKALDAVPA